jgi:hypothetical protein
MQLNLLLRVQYPYTIVSIPNQLLQTGMAARNGSTSFFLYGQNEAIVPSSIAELTYCQSGPGVYA